MPIFPNINTLANKPTLTGNEVIQISATEKVTLNQILQQLGYKGGLPTFTPETPLGDAGITISDNDTILTALEKLYGRIGGDYYNVAVVRDVDSEEVARLVIRSIDEDTEAFVAGIEISSFTINTYFLSGQHVYEEAPTDPEEIWGYLVENGYHISIRGDRLRSSAGMYPWLSPNDVLLHGQAAFTQLRLDYSEWNKALLNAQAMFILPGSGNVPRSKISMSGGNATFLFSDDFDSATGTTHQCVTFQLFSKSGGMLYFLVNKCGYSES